MDHFQKIYAAHGDAYEDLVAYEDVEGNLLKAMRAVASIDDALVVDVGAGTGRVGRQLLNVARRVVAVELNESMLRAAQKQQRALHAQNWQLVLGDARQLPLSSHWANVAVAGWVLGHFAGWYADRWQAAITTAIDEMKRVVHAPGQVIIIETMGTGFDDPQPPAPQLATYYDWLENVQGFQRQVIRTDYAFPTVERAAQSLGFFFGDELRQRMLDEQVTQLIEWTGVWSISI